jgi:lipopolysaccharide transport system permease protein
LEKKIHWDWEIKPETKWLGVSFKELYAYKDLLFRLVRKEFLTSYQQTLLGPFWVVLQPLLAVMIYVLVFGKVIGVPTEGIPPFLYYLTGITLWNLFSDIFLGTSTTFAGSAHLFSKVYFPRIIVPLSIMLLHSLRFLIQLLLLVCFVIYYYFIGSIELPGINILFAIPVIITTAGIALGGGLVCSVLTAKYRDLVPILQLVVRLLMFVCPIFYSYAIVPGKMQWVVMLNPLSSQFEFFRYAFLEKGHLSGMEFLYSFIFMVLLICSGVLLFNKIGDKLIDVL